MTELLKRVYESKKISTALKIISHVCVAVGVVSYIAMLLDSASRAYYRGGNHCLLQLSVLILSAGVPFVIVTVLRRLINAPRPYELYDFYEVKPKNKSGQSFPSRHVFSAFVIATLACCLYSPLFGIPLFVIGAVLAASRVLLGMHFIRDVVAGALIGIVSGILGVVIIPL